MSSIWNYLSPLRTGHVYLAKSGNEMFGTVIKHGVNKKTVTVPPKLIFLGPREHPTLEQQIPTLPKNPHEEAGARLRQLLCDWR